jgi:ribosomal protein S18 acetylase RimI-like enzyme
MNEASLGMMVHALDLDLDASRVAVVDGDAAGLVLLGVRGTEGWISGMGVRPTNRRQGVGSALMDSVLAEALDRDLATIRLEVIDGNEPALRLYENLGFERVRDVEVWALDGEESEASLREGPIDAALTRIRALRTEREPWQRDDATVERLRDLDPPPRAFLDDGGAAVFRVSAAGVSLLQLAAESDVAATSLVRAVRGEGTPLRALNLTEGHPAARAIAALGGRVEVRQHELALCLTAS